MSAKLNKVSIIGNLGKDVVLNKTNTSGKAVCNIRVAVNDSWKDKTTGQKMEKTEWFTVVCWNALAENVAQYTRSGSQVYVEGRLQTGRPYMSKAIGQDGKYVLDVNGANFMVQKTDMEIIATNVQFLDKKPEDTAYAATGQAVAPAAAPVQAAPVAPAPVVAAAPTAPVVVATPEAVSGTFVQPPAGV